MPKLVLQLEDRVLRECALSADVTIGRQPDNTVSVDNPAVSARHARIARHSDGFIVEDLESRNGTFVNEHQVTRHTLTDGDVVLVGKHKLVFDARAQDDPGAADTVAMPIPDFGGTLLLDTDQQRKLLAAVEARMRAAAATEAPDGGGSPASRPAQTVWHERCESATGPAETAGALGGLLLVILGAGGLAWLISWQVNLNEFSLHTFYRNRLVRCFLGASRERKPHPFTGFDDEDDLPLTALASIFGMEFHSGLRDTPVHFWLICFSGVVLGLCVMAMLTKRE